MLLERFVDKRLAQVSYLLACRDENIALVIDPARDITPYLQAAEEHEVRIAYVAETHVHADFISGSRELAAATGAQILLSGEGGRYAFPNTNVRLLEDDTHLMIGKLRLDVVHTPGHTPEHLMFVVYEREDSPHPLGAFVGDVLCAGGIGTLDAQSPTPEAAAEQQFASLHKIRQMPPYVQIWPGHNALCRCCSATREMAATTVGYEIATNPAYQPETPADYVQWRLSRSVSLPPTTEHISHSNRTGPTLLMNLPQAQHIHYTPGTDIVPPDALFIDTRPVGVFARKHWTGSINVPVQERLFSQYLSWYVHYDRPTFFIAYQNDVQTVLQALFALGIEDIPGYFTPDVLQSAGGTLEQVDPRAVPGANMLVLDVRESDEYAERRVPGSLHLPMGAVIEQLNDIPRDRAVAVLSETGVRSQVVASVLQRAGLSNVVNVAGGLRAWEADGLPVE